MSNDTTTLNGALAELGETMATNITAKGVSASASYYYFEWCLSRVG